MVAPESLKTMVESRSAYKIRYSNYLTLLVITHGSSCKFDWKELERRRKWVTIAQQTDIQPSQGQTWIEK